MNYALLVGIDRYKNPKINPLNGCENDILAFEDYLRKESGVDMDIVRLLNEDATRNNLITQFRSHLAKARAGELALFYFSGHGCREISPKEFVPHQGNDKYHECIVCHDSDIDAYDLADKEIRLLIRELSDKGVEVVVIFDCCHSGSGTKRKKNVNVRQIAPKVEAKDRARFLPEVWEDLGNKPPRHIFLAACRKDETAKEREIEGQMRGLFSYSLLKALKQPTQIGMVSYKNLETSCSYAIARYLGDTGSKQSPLLETAGDVDPHRLFLQASDDKRRPDYYSINKDEAGRYKVNLGRIHGLNALEGKARFAVYQKEGDDLLYVGEAQTAEIGLYDSEVQLPENYSPRSELSLLVKATYLPYKRLLIFALPDAAAHYRAELLKLPDIARSIKESQGHKPLDEAAIPASSPTLQDLESSIEISSEQSEDMRYQLIVDPGKGYRLVYIETGIDLVPGSDLRSPVWIPFEQMVAYKKGFLRIAAALMHIAKWERLRNLHSDAKKREEIEVSYSLELGSDFFWKEDGLSEVTLDLAKDPRTDKVPELDYELFMNNQTRIHKNKQKLTLVLYYQSRKYETIEVYNESIEYTEGKQAARIDQAKLSFPIDKESQLKQIMEHYQALACPHDIPFVDLAQTGSLAQVLFPKSQRDRVDIPRSLQIEKQADYWTTRSLSIKLLLELGSIGPAVLSLYEGNLVFSPHPTFSASVGVACGAQYMRGPRSDRYFSEQLLPEGIEILDLSPLGLKENVLEIHHIQNEKDLRKAPLEISLRADIASGHTILALTLPASLTEQKAELLPLLDEQEQLIAYFPVVGTLTQQGNGMYRFSLDKILPNPPDGRHKEGQSMKICFVSIEETALPAYWVQDHAGDGYVWIRADKTA